MANRFFKPVKKPDHPSQSEVRRAKEFWQEIFQDVIVAQVSDDSVSRSTASEDLVHFAGSVADRALEEMEKRWGKL